MCVCVCVCVCTCVFVCVLLGVVCVYIYFFGTAWGRGEGQVVSTVHQLRCLIEKNASVQSYVLSHCKVVLKVTLKHGLQSSTLTAWPPSSPIEGLRTLFLGLTHQTMTSVPHRDHSTKIMM